VTSCFQRGVNEVCALLGFYAAPIGSFLPTLRDNRWCLWNSHSGVGEDSSHLGVSPCRLVSSPSSQGQQSKMKALLSTKMSKTLRQSKGHNLHQHLCENVTSSRIEKTVPVRVTVYDASFTDLWISLPQSQKPHTGHIFHSVHYDTVCVFFLLHVGANRKHT